MKPAGEVPIEKLDKNMAAQAAGEELSWTDARELTIEGRGWDDTECFYHRLPARAQGLVPAPVWNLAQRSAGMAVRFVTDAPAVSARWSVLNAVLSLAHMPATGVSGLDLYVRHEGAWHWVGLGRATNQVNEQVLAGGMEGRRREYLLYLPLYNGTTSLEIGVPAGSTLQAARPAEHKPFVVYGTSIVQGGVASRPGMAYPAILGRRLGRPHVNLGFSGNGRMELALADLLGELDASVYVLDCLPNMQPDMVAERVAPFVRRLRSLRAATPIVLVENITYQQAAFVPGRANYRDKNRQLSAAYQALLGEGVGGLYYVPGAELLGGDGEATVDGTHPTDLGFLRMADVIEPHLRPLV